MEDEDLLPKPSADMSKLWAAVREVMSKPLSGEELKAFVKDRESPPNPKPFIKSEDLNNKTEKDISDCNPVKRAVSIGFKWSF